MVPRIDARAEAGPPVEGEGRHVEAHRVAAGGVVAVVAEEHERVLGGDRAVELGEGIVERAEARAVARVADADLVGDVIGVRQVHDRDRALAGDERGGGLAGAGVLRVGLVEGRGLVRAVLHVAAELEEAPVGVRDGAAAVGAQIREQRGYAALAAEQAPDEAEERRALDALEGGADRRDGHRVARRLHTRAHPARQHARELGHERGVDRGLVAKRVGEDDEGARPARVPRASLGALRPPGGGAREEGGQPLDGEADNLVAERGRQHDEQRENPVGDEGPAQRHARPR